MLGMICVDVDGTLVGSGNVIRDDVWAALRDARERGMHLTLCSGRSAIGNARAYATRLDGDGWHIFQNGASIVRVGSGESLSAPFPPVALPALIARAGETGRLLEIYTDQAFAITRPCELAERHAAVLGVPYQPRRPDQLDGPVVRVQWVVPRSEEDAVVNEAHAGLSLHPAGSPAMPEVSFISVTRAGVSKGSAIERVAARYGVPLDRVMMVGDGENDVTAMRVVGHPVAMGNADAPAIAASRHRVAHVDDGGLREAVELALSL